MQIMRNNKSVAAMGEAEALILLLKDREPSLKNRVIMFTSHKGCRVPLNAVLIRALIVHPALQNV